jgi:mycoredoxin
MKGTPIRIFTTTWCGDCFRAKSFLDRNGVRYEEVDIEKNDAALKTVMTANGGKRRVPTFEVNGQFYGNPPITELARIVGLADGAPPEAPRAAR